MLERANTPSCLGSSAYSLPPVDRPLRPPSITTQLKQSHLRVIRRAPRPLKVSAETSFHQDRLAASDSKKATGLPPLELTIRAAERDDEIEAAAWLRARAFYAYPPERKFAGEIHQLMVAEEEVKSLKAQRLDRMLKKGRGEDEDESQERCSTLIALCKSSLLGEQDTIDERLLITDDGDTWNVAAGTLDLHAVRALPGEVLIGSCTNAAYLANVCTAEAARRRGVGEQLLLSARNVARDWGVDGLYVHTMAVNEIAMAFYMRNGFVVEKEESSNQAHYRGRCLDGIEGRGRTVLLRDSRL